MDHAVSAFLDDVEERGLSDQILLIVTGEMGRSPIKRNKDAGTEHHGGLTPLMLAGGGLNMGQTIGKSDRTGSRPATEAYGPENLLSTVMHTMFDANKLRVSPELLPPDITKLILETKPIKELF